MKFFHRTAGAKFYMPDGKDIAFAGGEFDTETLKDRPEVKAAVELELRKVANVPSSMIFTISPVAGMEESMVVREITASATQSFDEQNKIPAGTQTQPLPIHQDTKPTLQTTGVEHAHIASSTSSPASSMAEQLAHAKKMIAEAGKGPASPLTPNPK